MRPHIEENIRFNIIKMIVPITAENMLMTVAIFITAALVGRLTASEIAAVGLGSRYLNIFMAIFRGISTGATVLIAQFYGAGYSKKISNTLRQSLVSALLVCIGLASLMYLFAPQLIQLFSDDPAFLAPGVIYLRYIVLGLIPLAMMLIVTGALQAVGDTVTPMIIALIMNFLNAGLAYILIFGAFGIPSLGVKGAAIAQSTAYFVAALIGLSIIFKRKEIYQLHLNTAFFNLDFKETLRVYKLGMPTAGESLCWVLASMVIIKVILTYGVNELAAYQLGLQAESLSYKPAGGFGIVATALIGQTLGARLPNMGKAYLKKIMQYAMVMTTLSVIALTFFPAFLLGLLTDKTELIAIAVPYLIIMGLVQYFQNGAAVFSGSMRGAGFTHVPFLVSGSGILGVRLGLTFLFALVFKLPLFFIWIAIAVDILFRFFFSVYLFKKKNIFHHHLIEELEA